MAKLRRDCSDRMTGVTLSVALASVLCALADPGAAATRRDPDWPCQQIKVPTISAAAVWSGPSLEGLGSWSADEEVADLVARLAARRTPLDEAQKLIDAFSRRLAPRSARGSFSSSPASSRSSTSSARR